MIMHPLRQNAARGPVARSTSIPAPVGGWDDASPLVDMEADRAIVLDNWFPSTGYVEVRRGHKTHAAGMGSDPVPSLMSYHGRTTAASKMFAVTGGTIYDVTSEANATATSETSLSIDRWQHVNFTTSGGPFLVCVSGSDAVRNFNGSVWSSPSITGSGISSSDFIHVNAHKKRLWFIIKDSMDAAYLPADSIAGTATKFQIGSLFSRGGHLVAMATYTQDAGSGPDDFAVFITSKGQVAVYGGSDPSSSSTWSLVGVYDIGPPLGRRCFTKVGGDIALINMDGLLPLSKAWGVDRGAVEQIAFTARINNAMNTAARMHGDLFGWQLCPYPRGTMAILNVPLQETALQHQYVMNTLTGAWCRFTGMNANCWEVFNDNLYFGGNDGIVYRADFGAIDVDAPIDAVGQTAYNYLGSQGRYKLFKMMQPLVTTDSPVKPSLGVSSDFSDNATIGIPTSAAVEEALYDEAVWDADVYPVETRNSSDWTDAQNSGRAFSIHFRARTGPESDVSVWGSAVWGDNWSVPVSGEVVVKLNGFNAIYELGGFM